MTGTSIESPPARRLGRPRWTDPRLLGGVVLILLSVAIGARVVGQAEDGDLVWVASRDLPAGTTIQADDLEARAVRVPGSISAYVDASDAPPTGYVVVRGVAAGELVPAAALTDADPDAEARLVSVPVAHHHYPAGLGRGQRVDVYVVTDAALGPTDAGVPEPRLVLEDAPVADVSAQQSGFGAGGAGIGVVLEVDAADVADVVAAVSTGSIQMVLVPDVR